MFTCTVLSSKCWYLRHLYPTVSIALIAGMKRPSIHWWVRHNTCFILWGCPLLSSIYSVKNKTNALILPITRSQKNLSRETGWVHRRWVSENHFLYREYSCWNSGRAQWQGRNCISLWNCAGEGWDSSSWTKLYSALFSDSKGLSNPGEVEALREKVYASLEAYCKQKYPDQPGRYRTCFVLLVLRLRMTSRSFKHSFWYIIINHISQIFSSPFLLWGPLLTISTHSNIL